MAAAAPDCAPAPSPSPAPALALWSAINVAALALAAFRVPLSAGYSQPAELLAPQVVLVTQVAAAGMLFPMLTRTTATAVCAVASVFPFAAAAAFVGAKGQPATLAAAVFVASWVATLAVGNRILRTPAARMLGVALANLLTIGEPVLHYLGQEFARPPAASIGPTLHVLAILDGRWGKVGGWIPVAAVLGAAITVKVTRKCTRADAAT